MMRLPAVLSFVVLTFVCWGSYGPVLHIGQNLMNHSRWRPFMCVGLSYFLIAVVVPLIVLQGRKETGRWTLSGTFWSVFAGSIGAVGALGIVLAFEFGGKPVYVMPIVFGGAPVVNTFVTMWMQHTQDQASLKFYAAVLLVAIGAAGVFVFRPSAIPSPVVASADAEVTDESPNDVEEEEATETSPLSGKLKAVLAVLMTAACWGSYGPFLHKGQGKMHGSRLRPFICVGAAYFLVAVLVPALFFLPKDPHAFTIAGSFWSLLAGAVGAVGALGIIMAFNFGGRPVFVMPLVFGGAPIINTIISMSKSYMVSGQLGQITPWFLGSLLMVISGAVTVLLFAPRPRKVPGKAPKAAGKSAGVIEKKPEAANPSADKEPEVEPGDGSAPGVKDSSEKTSSP